MNVKYLDTIKNIYLNLIDHLQAQEKTKHIVHIHPLNFIHIPYHATPCLHDYSPERVFNLTTSNLLIKKSSYLQDWLSTLYNAPGKFEPSTDHYI